MTIKTKKLPITALLSLIKEWEGKYHLEKTGTVIFQNSEYMFNVQFTNKSLNIVKKNPRGIEHLPMAITSPDEIWGLWENQNDQKVAIINYILKDDTHLFCVTTNGGEVVKTAINTISNINLYRKGIKFLK
jgi:hypothetical protein